MYDFINFLRRTRGCFPSRVEKSITLLTRCWGSLMSGLYLNVLISLSCCQVGGHFPRLKFQMGDCDQNKKRECLIFLCVNRIVINPQVHIYYNKKRSCYDSREPWRFFHPCVIWAIYPKQSQQHFQSFYKGHICKNTRAASQVPF